jgi:malonyl-CoA O-methyltransferase
LARIATRLRAAPQPPWLHGEVARRMAARLPLVRQKPARVVDWEAGLGASSALLRETYPRASLIAVQPTPAREAAPWWLPQRWSRAPVVMAPQVLGAEACELLWSNMALHFEHDIESLLERWRQAIVVDGFLMFSTLGPGSLDGLRGLYRSLQWPTPMAPLVDMHDLGDMLVRAGFAEPVMDQETLTLTWPTTAAMLTELRSLGGNADPARGPGLRTPRWRAQLDAACEALRGSDGRLRLEFEVIYGHAFCAAPRVPVSAESTLSLEQMRSMVQGRGRGQKAS